MKGKPWIRVLWTFPPETSGAAFSSSESVASHGWSEAWSQAWPRASQALNDDRSSAILCNRFRAVRRSGRVPARLGERCLKTEQRATGSQIPLCPGSTCLALCARQTESETRHAGRLVYRRPEMHDRLKVKEEAGHRVQLPRPAYKHPQLIFHGEFDPGSGRTLAACLTHAS